MSQNRQARRDRLQADHDYEINRKAELEIEDMQADLDRIKEHQELSITARLAAIQSILHHIDKQLEKGD
ncbi:MAG: DUF1003 domain-containing protein [Rubrobacteridae bacterium]|nr:DUF1003 domain-containing protein [Rubrobacteridae bacterium]